MLLFLGAISGIVLMVWLTREREPMLQGKKLSEWCSSFAPGSRSAAWTADTRNQEAERAIRQIGTNALPFLLEDINCTAPTIYVYRIRELGRRLPDSISPRMLHNWCWGVDEVHRRERAAFAFLALGTIANPAIPELRRRLDGEQYDSANYAAAALFLIGETAVPALAGHLTNTNAANRFAIIESLGQFARFTTNASSLIPLVVNCVTNSTGMERRAAGYALAEMAAVDPKYEALVVPTLTRELESVVTNDWRRFHFAYVKALGGYGTKARIAVPILEKIVAMDASGPAELRGAASNALWQIAPEVFTNTFTR